jgi:threonine/homoserine/homoserine lactone efflux protein
MSSLALFVPACFALNLAFGPNNLLALTHGAAVGPGFALRAGLGRLIAFVPMLALSGAGLGLLLSASAVAFTALKLAGAAYLVWLGVKVWRSAAAIDLGAAGAVPTAAEAFRREMLTALTNPKAILIFAAFFPQFVDPDRYAASFVELGAVFLVLEALALWLYALGGRLVATAARDRLRRLQQASGLCMVGFGLLLLLARPPAAA